jgi:hypothetical protein
MEGGGRQAGGGGGGGEGRAVAAETAIRRLTGFMFGFSIYIHTRGHMQCGPGLHDSLWCFPQNFLIFSFFYILDILGLTKFCKINF